MDTPSVPTVFHLRRARDLMDRHFAEPLDLDVMAAAAGFSRYHFARTFRAAYGETPAHYLTRRRVERAQDLLRTTSMTVTDICHTVGFASLGTFSRTFTTLVGSRPSAYRSVAAAPVPACFAMAWGLPGHPNNPISGSASSDNEPPHQRP
jgi:transcriptional regulator GlxA family with amidase domain